MTVSSPLADRGPAAAVHTTAARPARARRAPWIVAGILAVLVGALAFAGAGTGYVFRDAPASAQVAAAIDIPSDPKDLKQLQGKFEKRQRQLLAALEKKRPKSAYIVIDQTQNQLLLRKDDAVLLNAKVSAGSGMVLKETGGKERKWVFDTPRGEFRVLNRVEDPMWKKPDWAFVEEGKPIPRKDADRFEAGSLGEYALYFGNGFMIHGTLYERFLGRSVSHGCVRVGRDDLREVWRAAPIGTPIFIY